ncbi:translation initiation factor IF-2 [Candidatus Xianfuyuplasma coldseepsis]|uniref:Translation initiation factor IF-2 n=1 Tax=Candidatus Xianfuyuplasma coldseepsis TaxID=2782163 RepID=A0A7L7KQY5_9MOLU|nr:translation initiation factor IF-2 [Xianfuyuplasma coldseepsis]QMS84364.1 translation initiation factor IF-2 [Xianfuyuplasma coldseepsis]
MARKSKKQDSRKSNIPVATQEKTEGVLYYSPDMTVADIAEGLGVKTSAVIKKLMMAGIMANQTQTVDRETVELLAIEFGRELEDEQVTDLTRFDEIDIVDTEEDLVERPPVVTIMGHVDHGKTTLLDTIRNSRVTEGEAGGITQHIGAYQVKKNGKLITFIDTPGHAAFTEMRARGAQVTDITILVVAADDGVMPQTKEAIDHAKAADVPIIVAVNKIDKVGVNPDKVKQELTEYNLVPEEWGGETIFCNLSALTGEGVDNLLEMIQLTAEMEEYKANPNRLASGTVIESKLDKGKGPVATLLVANGSLKVGDILVAGNTYGRVRAMVDDQNVRMDVAMPSKAVEVTGLNDVPQAGDSFMVFQDERRARLISEERTHRAWAEERGVGKAVSLEELFSQMSEGDLKELRIVIKGDTHGSIEALKASLEKIEVEGAKIDIIRSSVGTITETDVTLALASNAIIMGFNVRPRSSVRDLAKEKGVDIRLYNIIYKALEEVEAALTGMLDPIFEEVVTGQAEVRDTFKISKVGTVAGCYVTDGTIERNSLVRVLRDGVVIFEGQMSSLKRFKDDVKEVREGYECGIMIEKFNDVKVGDVIEASVEREIPRK